MPINKYLSTIYIIKSIFPLLDLNRFCEISGLVGVDSAQHARVVRDELQRADGCKRREHIWQVVVDIEAQINRVFRKLRFLSRKRRTLLCEEAVCKGRVPEM